MIGGKVLDPSALAAYVQGNIGAETWLAVATVTGLVLYLPALAVVEARAVYPDSEGRLDRVLRNPSVVYRELGRKDAARVADLLAKSRVFDAAIGHVALVARQRGWPVLTADPGRLLRVVPDLDIEEL